MGELLGIILPWIVLAAGLVLLIKGADWFVDGASGVAAKFGVPSLVIGLTIVAFGTSAPEAAVSVSSALKGSSGISLGNVVGSNLFNLLMVVGFCSIIRPTVIDKSIMKKDYPYSLLATIVLALAMLDKFFGDMPDNVITRTDGFIILAFFSIFMYYTISSGLGAKEEVEEKKETKSLVKLLVLLGVGIAAIVIGGKAVVEGASDIARSFGVSETLIGLTIVAVGTSLPEFVTSVVAIRKGEDDIAIGNVVGSNVFNILFIVGIAAAIKSITVDPTLITDIFMLLGISVVFYLAVLKKRTVNRAGGMVMVATYVAYMIYAIVR